MTLWKKVLRKILHSFCYPGQQSLGTTDSAGLSTNVAKGTPVDLCTKRDFLNLFLLLVIVCSYFLLNLTVAVMLANFKLLNQDITH